MIDDFGCIENTIKVHAGRYFDLKNPQAKDVDIGTIAAALSKTCRFGGHCPKFYSVAEHCVHATLLAEDDGFFGDHLRAILLHDAAEAYVGDLVKPLKQLIPEFWAIELKVEEAIEARFKIPFREFKSLIKRYDRLMLQAEKCFMWPSNLSEWKGFAGQTLRPVRIEYWSPEEAESKFLMIAQNLKLET